MAKKADIARVTAYCIMETFDPPGDDAEWVTVPQGGRLPEGLPNKQNPHLWARAVREGDETGENIERRVMWRDIDSDEEMDHGVLYRHPPSQDTEGE